MVRGKVVLTGVPDNVVVSPASSGAAFVGAKAPTSSSCHVINLGILEDYKFMCLFIAKIWWIARVGRSASEIPMETQMLMLEVGEDSVLGVAEEEAPAMGQRFYVLMLAVLDEGLHSILLPKWLVSSQERALFILFHSVALLKC
ncbi:probable galactinol--sucrose galactosyltransferase 1 [Salvia splendens]|uniref:probable galactinol--sucrose galactosyltransferase 1 n=1 Tax=Salvia splendens TaxID=180675 RepID=UPI001C25CB4A|nr:probable galactinol--sucrose galactosyltransferase 1 [Salvia splendens]